MLTIAISKLFLSESPVIKNIFLRIDNAVYDNLLRQFNPFHVKDKTTVILDIDEKSIKKLGRWPWSRKTIADIVNKLTDAGAITISFDVLFSEKEISVVDVLKDTLQNNNVLDTSWQHKLKKITPLFEPDKTLAKSLNDCNVLLAFSFTPDANVHIGKLPKPLQALPQPIAQHLPIPNYPGCVSSLPILLNNAANSGFFKVKPDQDGVLR